MQVKWSPSENDTFISTNLHHFNQGAVPAALCFVGWFLLPGMELVRWAGIFGIFKLCQGFNFLEFFSRATKTSNWNMSQKLSTNISKTWKAQIHPNPNLSMVRKEWGSTTECLAKAHVDPGSMQPICCFKGPLIRQSSKGEPFGSKLFLKMLQKYRKIIPKPVFLI